MYSQCGVISRYSAFNLVLQYDSQVFHKSCGSDTWVRVLMQSYSTPNPAEQLFIIRTGF